MTDALEKKEINHFVNLGMAMHERNRFSHSFCCNWLITCANPDYPDFLVSLANEQISSRV
eukprot:scaffold2482_cov116-Cylindrotheca_fusiformis.AAC.7